LATLVADSLASQFTSHTFCHEVNEVYQAIAAFYDVQGRPWQ
jgi:hypothetical protein